MAGAGPKKLTVEQGPQAGRKEILAARHQNEVPKMGGLKLVNAAHGSDKGQRRPTGPVRDRPTCFSELFLTLSSTESFIGKKSP